MTAAQATEDLNALGAWLSKTYPGDDEGVKFTLARPGLIGDMLGGPARAFMAGLMLLAGLILLAACANLGSLFAARTADRAKETALRLALGSRRGLILRQMLTEAVLVSLAGGALGLAGGVVILRLLSAWQPIPDIPINVPVNPDAATYLVALVLALASGLLFGMVPVRQVMRADPWQMIRTGAADVGGMRRFTLRDVLLAVQIAICAVLVTSSLVAVRGLARSMHSNFGFVPQNVMLGGTDLHMAGYTDERMPQMQRRMLDAAAAIPGVTAVGYVDNLPLSLGGGDSCVYTDSTTDFRPTNEAADAMNYNISPGYLEAAGTNLLAGRDLTMQDDSKAPKVALVNRQFAVKVFGSVNKAIGGHFKFNGGQRAEVVGVVEDGKYRTLTEDQQPAMFFSFLQQQSSDTWLLVRSKRDPQEISTALEKAARTGCGDAYRREDVDPGNEFSAVCRARGLGGARRAGAAGRDAGGDGNLRYGFVYREQTAARTGDSHGAWRAAQAGVADGAGPRVRAAFGWLGGWTGAGPSGDEGVVIHRVPGFAERSGGVRRRGSHDADARAGGSLDSGAEGAGRKSRDAHAGGVSRRVC